MKFEAILWLFTGTAATALLAWLLVWSTKKARADLARFASPHLQAALTRRHSPSLRIVKHTLILLAVVLLFAAMARPQWGHIWRDERRTGTDLLIALDTSRSMLAQDIKPNRIERAKLAIVDLIQLVGSNRIGLITFAGEAFLQVPLTLDHEAFLNTLQQVQPGIVQLGGTDIATAIQEAEAALQSNPQSRKFLILITDGEDLEGKAKQAATEAAQRGLTIFTVGVGTPEGDVIPITDRFGQQSLVMDNQGNFVKSKLVEDTLQAIANAGNGRYEPLGADGQGLETIYREELQPLAKTANIDEKTRVPLEQFQWPLALAILLLTIEWILRDYRNRPTRTSTYNPTPPPPNPATRKPTKPTPAVPPVLSSTPLILFFLLLSHSPLRASIHEAAKAYHKGDFQSSAEILEKQLAKKPDDPSLSFNYGAASYRSGNFPKAATAFKNALKTDDLQLQQRTYYNLGNTLYRQGEATLPSSQENTIALWKSALESYQRALALQNSDEDARFNYEFVKKKLEELQKQQEQQQQQNNQQQQQQQDNQNGSNQPQDQQQNQQQPQNQDESQNQDNQDNQDNPAQPQNPEGQQPQNQDPQQNKQQPQTADAQANQKPDSGEMSKDQAEALLDSLQDDLGQYPMRPQNRGEQKKRTRDLQDW